MHRLHFSSKLNSRKGVWYTPISGALDVSFSLVVLLYAALLLQELLRC
jgi:hypothetical protein